MATNTHTPQRRRGLHRGPARRARRGLRPQRNDPYRPPRHRLDSDRNRPDGERRSTPPTRRSRSDGVFRAGATARATGPASSSPTRSAGLGAVFPARAARLRPTIPGRRHARHAREASWSPVGHRPGRPRPTVSIHIGDWPSGVYLAQLTASGARGKYARWSRPRATSRTSDRGRARNADVAGVQLRRRERRRVARHMVCRLEDEQRAASSARSSTAASPRTGSSTTLRSCAGSCRRTARSTPSPTQSCARCATATLANAYSLIVFSGLQGVTTHEYDVVTRYRDLGVTSPSWRRTTSSWKITIANHVMTRIAQWRDLGGPPRGGADRRAVPRQRPRRPSRRLDSPQRRGGYALALRTDRRRLLRERRDRDRRHRAVLAEGRPRLAEIPDLYGPGFTAQMTYYETPAGARVRGGAFTLAGSVWGPKCRTGPCQTYGSASAAVANRGVLRGPIIPRCPADASA